MQPNGRPEMTVYTINEDPKVKTRARGTIAMCTRDSIKAATAISWLMTDLSFLGPYEYVARSIVVGHLLVAQRNECVANMQGDWILFIDDDMTWQPSDVRTLVETRDKWDLDMVGGLCFQRGEPYQPTMLYENVAGGGYTYRESWPEDTAVEVDATGLAFCLIHKRVFEKMLGEPFPTQEERKRLPPPPFFAWGTGYGEDIQFCREAKAKGVKIFVDTAVKVGHIGDHVITERDFVRELAFRPEPVIELRKDQLAPMNLEPVTKEEAMTRLIALADE